MKIFIHFSKCNEIYTHTHTQIYTKSRKFRVSRKILLKIFVRGILSWLDDEYLQGKEENGSKKRGWKKGDEVRLVVVDDEEEEDEEEEEEKEEGEGEGEGEEDEENRKRETMRERRDIVTRNELDLNIKSETIAMV